FKLIKAFGIDEYTDWSAMEAYDEYCDYFLFDTKTALHGGSGLAFNWDLLSHYSLIKPLFLSGGIGVDDIPRIKQLAQKTSVEIVDLNSKLEISRGIKDIGLCRQAIEFCKKQE
ncbi:MAG TPA: phosphoribosylanthranilate isomerase, partial [Chitinophagales bacterium]|nr:phosphoribosylanthranilate isomerase [Chitinophagales bacterium]